MVWGTFSIPHIISLAAVPAIYLLLYFFLRNKTQKLQKAVLCVLSFSGIAAIIFNLLEWGSPIEYLPFHLCSLTAMVLPIAVITGNKILSNLLLLWSLGSFAAIFLNHAVTEAELFGAVFNFFYFPHVLEFIIPILIFSLGISKLDIRCIISTVIITFAVYTVIYFINLGLNEYCVNANVTDWKGDIVRVNYMYSIIPDNPLLALFHKIIPYEYWYMYLVTPIIVAYLGAIYGIHALVALIRKVKSK